MVAAQGIEVGTHPLKFAARLLKALLHVADRIGQGGLGVTVEQQVLVDDHMRHLRPDQSREV
ncbi:MAG: hypothetical protein B0D87_00700, partial [Candidatus Sedimenticola endophacoides]